MLRSACDLAAMVCREISGTAPPRSARLAETEEDPAEEV
jgi:hypothetical protein